MQRFAIALVLCPILLLCAGFSRGDEPTYFRSRHGLAGDGALPDDFEKDARLLWKAQLPGGISTPCVCGDRVFLTTFEKEAKRLATVAIDRETGKTLWKQVAEIEQLEQYHPTGSPASSTVACNGERVFAFFGSRGLSCYGLDGQLLWERRMGPFQDEFGASSSPVLVDGLVILNEDHDVDSFLIALDQQTGEVVWKTPRPGFTRSYSTPVVWDSGDGKQVIVAGSLQLAAYDVQTGEKQWWVNGLSRIVDTTPNLVDGVLYLATWTPGGDPGKRIAMPPFASALKSHDRNEDGKIAKSELPETSPVVPRFFRIDLDQDQLLDETEWNKHAQVFERAQNVALAIEPGGEGDVTETAVKWIARRGLPTVPSTVVYDGVMYMVKDSGIVTTLDAKTGEQLKQGRAAGPGNYYASIVAGDGKVYLCSANGVLTVLKAGGRDWEVLSSHDFGERVLATPVVADGQFFVRTGKALYCYGKK